MSLKDTEECCPRFDPEPWDGKTLAWQDKPFVKDRVLSFLHIPLNFPAVMKRNMPRIMAAGAMPENLIVLSDENSLWGADVYIAVTGPVPGATMASISGTFLCKVFEGPFRNMRAWCGQMRQFVQAQGKAMSRQFCYYTTCPKCAKKYGKNYVALLAQVSP